MTLDEAIKNCKKKAEYYGELIITECEDGREFYNSDAERYAEEHEQLAKWLSELKELKEAYESDYQIDDLIQVCVRLWG